MANPNGFLSNLLGTISNAPSVVYKTVSENPGSSAVIGGLAILALESINGGPSAVIAGTANGAFWIVGGAVSRLADTLFSLASTTAVFGGGVYLAKKHVENKNYVERAKNAVFNEPPEELLPVEPLINKILANSNTFTEDDVIKLYKHLTPLLENDNALLIKIAPDSSIEQINLCTSTVQMIQNVAEDINHDLAPLKEDEAMRRLQEFAQFFNSCMSNKQGLLLKTLNYFDPSAPKVHIPIVEDGKGLIPRAKQIVQKRINIDGMTEQTPPLLLQSHTKLAELKTAIGTKNKTSTEKLSKELVPLLKEFTEKHATVLIKQPLSDKDLQLFIDLEEKLPRFYGENPLPQEQIAETLENVVKAMTGYYEAHTGLAVRVGDVVMEKFTNTVNSVCGRIEQLPRQAIDHFWGKKQPTTNEPRVVDVTNEPDASAGESTISQFLSSGISYLKGMAGNGGGFLSKLAASTFAGWLISGVNLFLPEMRKAGVPEQAITAFEQILVSLNEAQISGSFTAVIAQMETAAKVLKANNIITSVHGIPIPLIGAPSEKKEVVETSYSDNIALLKEAINAPFAPSSPNQNWEDLALEENKKLVYNISNFLALKHIYEEVCGLKPDYETFYLTLIAEATKNGATTSTSKLKQILLNKLEEKNVGYLRRVWAGWKFSGFRLLTKKYTAQAVTVYFKEIFKYISENKSDDFNTLRKMMMTNFTGYLTTLGGAYSSIANDPRPSGTKEQMLEKELSKKESNRGFEPLELYKELARTVIQKMTGEGIFSWITWQLTKLFLDPAQIVKEIVDTSTTMQDVRGYSHALNTVIREELDEIWDLLRAEHLNPQTDPNPAVSNEVSEGNKKQLSALVKNLFEVLGKGKCDTLDELRRLLAEKDMTAKINQTIDGFYIPDVIEKISTILAVTIESLAKEDQLQKLTYKFSSLLNQSFVVGNVVTQEQMQDEERKIAKRSEQILLYAVNSAINDLYDTSGKKQQGETNRFITDLQKQSDKYINGTQNLNGAKQDLIDLTRMQDIASLEAKNKINKITEEALAYANYCHETDLTVKSSQLSSGNKEEVAKRCLSIAEKSSPFVVAIAKLKTHSNSLEDIRIGTPHLKGIEAILADVGIKLFNNKPTLTAEDIIYAETRVMALEEHVAELKKMKESKNNTEQISADLQRIASLSQKLDNAGQNEALLSELKVDLLKYWNNIKKNNAEITVANLKKQEFVNEQKKILREQAEKLNETFNLIVGLDTVVKQMENVATILVDLSRANATKILQEELILPNSIFDQIVYDKKQHIGKLFKNAELDAKVATLRQQLLGSVPSTFRTQLMEQLKIIHEAPIEEQITLAQNRFLELLNQAVDKAANPSMAEERVKYFSSFNTIREATQRTRLLDPASMDTAKRGIREATLVASQHLDTFATWERETIKPVSYINFTPLDLKGPQDFTSGIIYGRVREHLNGFLGFLKRDDTYRYGLLHHLFLIPYIQAMKGPKV